MSSTVIISDQSYIVPKDRIAKVFGNIFIDIIRYTECSPLGIPGVAFKNFCLYPKDDQIMNVDLLKSCFHLYNVIKDEEYFEYLIQEMHKILNENKEEYHKFIESIDPELKIWSNIPLYFVPDNILTKVILESLRGTACYFTQIGDNIYSIAPIYNYNGKYLEFEMEGQVYGLKKLTCLKNGQNHGWSFEWNADGSVKSKTYYYEGKMKRQILTAKRRLN